MQPVNNPNLKNIMSQDSKKVLVAIGFSDQSLSALNEAAVFAKTIGAEIILLTVIEENSFVSRIFGSDIKEDVIRARVEKMLTELAEAKESEFGIKMTTMVSKGVVYEEIGRVSDLLKPELVVIGTNGRPTNFRSKLIGSNAYKVVTNVRPPVITTRGVKPFSGIDTIVFPLVLDRKSKEKVGPAVHYARLFGAKIKTVAVPKNDEEKAKLIPHVNQVSEFFTKAGIENTSEILEKGKKVAPSFLSYTEEVKGDIILIMEEGQEAGGLQIFTSDVQAIISNSEVPVMCITPSYTAYESQFSNF